MLALCYDHDYFPILKLNNEIHGFRCTFTMKLLRLILKLQFILTIMESKNSVAIVEGSNSVKILKTLRYNQV